VKFLLLFFFLLPSLCFTGCAPPPESPATLFLYYSGNVGGELERCGCSEKQLGGVARRKTLIDQMDTGPHLLLDAGDFLFGSFQEGAGSREFYRYKASAMVHSMDRMGYDAVMIGDYDFAEGKDFLLQRVSEASFPVVCSNLIGAEGKPVFSPFRIVVREGVRIAIVGFLDSNVVTKRYREALGDLKIEDPAGTAGRILPELAKKSDLIVALLHFNLIDPKDFLTSFPQIRVAVLGHSVGDGKVRRMGRAFVVAGTTLGKELGRLTLRVDGKGKITDARGELIPVTQELPEDPEIRKVVDHFNQTVRKKRFSEQVHFLPVPENSSAYAGAKACAPCHPLIYRQWRNTPHAYAFQTLMDKRSELNPECVVCHVVGYRQRSGFTGISRTPHLAGVQCESCHGPALPHVNGADIQRAVPEEVCRSCHDDIHSPAFDYPLYLQRLGHGREGSVPGS